MDSENYIIKTAENKLVRPLYESMIKPLIHKYDTIEYLFYLNPSLTYDIANEFFLNVRNIYFLTNNLELNQRIGLCISSEVEDIGEFRGLSLEKYFENNTSAVDHVKKYIISRLNKRGKRLGNLYEMQDGIYLILKIDKNLMLLFHEKNDSLAHIL